MKNIKGFDIRKEKDGTYTAFLAKYPIGYENRPYKTFAWTGAKTEKEAIIGLKNLYPELFPLQNSQI